ncbi:MAG: haloacid dehalogenase [Chloroflexi bacterium]|nr:haloacid dehalogenase [Chloroflexota bacterium]
MQTTSELETIVDRIVATLKHKNEVRDITLQRSREMIRFCANSIRATHRHEFGAAAALLTQAQEAAAQMIEEVREFPDLYYAGYVQDATKELAEAAITLAVVNHEPLPEPEALHIEYAAYLNGLGEATGEMRRYALDAMRRDELETAEWLLSVMDDVYTSLVTIDFPDALTDGLRRTTDLVRGVTERTRGDLTTTVQEHKLQAALREFENRLSSDTI